MFFCHFRRRLFASVHAVSVVNLWSVPAGAKGTAFGICPGCGLWPMGTPPSRSEFHDDLDAAVLFAEERLVKLGTLIERRAVRDDERAIDFPVFDMRKTQHNSRTNGVGSTCPRHAATGESFLTSICASTTILILSKRSVGSGVNMNRSPTFTRLAQLNRKPLELSSIATRQAEISWSYPSL